jgi:hypothetical protein
MHFILDTLYVIPDTNSMEPTSLSAFRGFLKMCVILVIPLGVAYAAIIIYGQASAASELVLEPTVVLRVPVTEKVWADIGAVMDPTVSLGVRTLTGFEKNEFVLDSGAVISSLPREWASKVGKDLAYAKRVAFKGFGNTTSFAYQSTIDLLLNNEVITLPVVFTESEGTKSLIGRKGFFDNYTVAFNHRDKIIEISQ